MMDREVIHEIPPLPQVPRDILNLIPQYDGDSKTLSLFLRKCEYVIHRYQGDADTNNYLIQSVTSKLTGKAAALISERGDYTTYVALKEILVQHFGDPRSEECVAIELETLKIKSNESYLEFCSRIQDVRAILLSKVNQSVPSPLREAKHIIYNNTSLNIFLYNLPEHMVRLVRIKNPNTLEQALSYVLEEVNFQMQYDLRSKMLQNKPTTSLPQNNFFKPQNQFKFSPGNQPIFRPNNPLFAKQFNNPYVPSRPNPFSQARQTSNFPYRTPFNYFKSNNNNQPQPTGFRPQPTGFRPQPGQFGYRPLTGFRPQAGQFGYKPPQPQGYQPPVFSNDVSMRTAPARPQQFPINETYTDDNPYYDPYYGYEYDDNMYAYYDEQELPIDSNELGSECDVSPQPQSDNNSSEKEIDSVGNFHITVPLKTAR